MRTSLYLTTTEPRCGKSLISLGITNLLLRRTGRVGVFRPIIDSKNIHERDKNIELLMDYFDLKINYEDTFAYLERDAIDLMGQGKPMSFWIPSSKNTRCSKRNVILF
jgi:phosphate acetyltransferase